MRSPRKRFATALEIEATRDAAAALFRQSDKTEDQSKRRQLNRRAMCHILALTEPMERDA